MSEIATEQTPKPIPKMNIFRSISYISKLFVKLAKDAIDPIIICVQILKLNTKNRTKEEIELIIPFLSQFINLKRLLINDDPLYNLNDIMREYANISFFKYYPRNMIIRKANEKQNWFFFILNGNIAVLAVKFEKLGLSQEEYFTYLIKLRLLGEQNMLTQCIRLNKAIIDIDESFFDSLPKIKYDIYESKAKAEIFAYNKSFNTDSSMTSSLNSYLQITYPAKSNGLFEKMAKIMFTIPNLEQVNTLTSGDFFGSLIPLESNSAMYQEKDFHTFIAMDDCDVTFINVKEHQEQSLFTIMRNKLKQTLYEEIISRFYIFQSIDRSKFEENYAKLFSYRFVKQGEKIILQNSLSEGVFLVLKGSFEVSTKRSYDEIDALIMQLKQSLDGMNDFISNLASREKDDKNSNKRMVYTRYKSEHFSGLFQNKKEIILNQVSSREVFGLNECFDYKTKMNHFTFKCISPSADLLFLQRDAYMYLYLKEQSMQTLSSHIIENKVEFYLETLKRYKDKFTEEAGIISSNTVLDEQLLPYNNYYLPLDLMKSNKSPKNKKMVNAFLNNLNSKEEKHNRIFPEERILKSEVSMSKNSSFKSNISNKFQDITQNLPTIALNAYSKPKETPTVTTTAITTTSSKKIKYATNKRPMNTQEEYFAKKSSFFPNKSKFNNKDSKKEMSFSSNQQY